MSQPSIHRPVVVLSLDGFARSSVGCYGCSWNQTPAINAIAGGGVVWDRMIAEFDDPSRVLRSWFQSDWMSAWNARGSLQMVTDVVMDPGSDALFSNVTRISPSSPPALPADDIVETQMGQLIAAAIECDQDVDDWSVLWIHSDVLTRCWDAPSSLYPSDEIDGDEVMEPVELELLTEPGEEDGLAIASLERIFDSTMPARIQRTTDDHPDWLSSWMRTYACQIRLLDVLIEVLLQSLSVHDPFFLLVGTSGYRLGQGGWIGGRGESLRSADIHLPFVVSDLGPLRVPRLQKSGSVGDVLLRLADPDPELPVDLFDSSRSDDLRIETQSNLGLRAVTTRDWFYVRNANDEESLFLKPDDVEDFNDVARVRNEITEEFRQAADELSPSEE